MARGIEGPWFRESKGVWYATVGGKSVSLGVKGDKADAVRAWHRLMAAGVGAKPAPKPVTVKELVAAFLSDAGTRLKPPTMRLYRLHLGAFGAAVGGVKADALTPPHVARWLHALPHGGTTKAMMLRSVSACLGWAAEAGLIPTNPAKRVAKPKSRSRSASAIIPEADHAGMLALASPAFRPGLAILHATGCRPGEACRITAESFDRAAGVVVLTDHKGDRTGLMSDS